MARTRKRAAWVLTEGPGPANYSVDPDPTGAAYLPTPNFEIGDLTDGKEPLETNFSTQRNFDTAPQEGPDGWSTQLTVPLEGLVGAAGDTVDASSIAVDYADTLWRHTFGVLQTTVGQVLAGGAGAATLPLSSAVVALQDLVPVFDPSLTALARAQWALIHGDGTTPVFDIVPSWMTPPTAAGVAYGAKTFLYDPVGSAGGDSIALVYRDDELEYTCLGGRVTDWTITAEARQMLRAVFTISGDRYFLNTGPTAKASLPPAACDPANTVLRGLHSPVWFNGAKFATRRIEIAGGVDANAELSTEAAEGRADFPSIGNAPTVLIEPLRTDAIRELRRQQTRGRLLMQLGAGFFNGTALNAMAAHAEQATVMQADPLDDAGRARQSVRFKISDRCTFSPVSGGPAVDPAARFFQLIRG